MIELPDVLSPDDLDRVLANVHAAPFIDGRVTAGPTARKVKSNQQADSEDAGVREAAGLVRSALEASDAFRLFARPVRWGRILFSRYGIGNAYGSHVDDPMMTGEAGQRFRTDLSFTLFLSDPATYEGGELVVETRNGVRQVRLGAGSVVIYPSASLHRVNAVTSGQRLACVGWIQSAIRREDQREILFDLGRIKGAMPEGDARLVYDKALSNLIRMWAEP